MVKDDEHKIPLEELCRRLDATPEGLSVHEAESRLRRYGENRLEVRRHFALIERCGRHFLNSFAILLWLGAALAFLAEHYSPGEGYLFIGIVICQVANVLICRTRRESIFKKGLFSNRLVLAGIAAELLLTGLLVYTPFAGTVFNTWPLAAGELFLALPFALFILLGDELRKVFVRRNHPFVLKYLSW